MTTKQIVQDKDALLHQLAECSRGIDELQGLTEPDLQRVTEIRERLIAARDDIYSVMQLVNDQDYGNQLVAVNGFPKCRISNKLKKFLALDRLQIAPLFISMVQQMEMERGLSQLPVSQMVRFNDLMYLAHLLNSSSAQFQQEAFTALQQALKSPRDEMQATLQLIREHVKLKLSDASEVEHLLKQLLYHLKQVAKQWRSILPAPLYLTIIGTLAGDLLSGVDVVMMDEYLTECGWDLSTVQCELLYDRLTADAETGLMAMVHKLVADEVKQLVRMANSVALISRGAQLADEQPAEPLIKSWRRMYLKVDLLNSSLATIEQNIRDCVYSQYLQPAELRRWISAIFADSDRRAQVIKLATMCD